MIRVATSSDLDQINDLLKRSRLNQMTSRHLEDECLVGEIDGKIRGVIWAGVTRSGIQASIDYFAVDPGYAGLGFRLARNGIRQLDALGVKSILTFVENSMDRDAAVKINERFGLKKEKPFYFLLTGNVKEMVAEWDSQKHLRRSRS